MRHGKNSSKTFLDQFSVISSWIMINSSHTHFSSFTMYKDLNSYYWNFLTRRRSEKEEVLQLEAENHVKNTLRYLKFKSA